MLGGRIFNDTFSPELTFQLDDVQLQLIRNGDPLSESDPLLPRALKIVERIREVPETLNILGLEFPVRTARWLSSTGLVLLIGLIDFFEYELMDSIRAGGFRHIKARYSPLLVSVDT